MRASLSTNSFLQRVILLANNFAVMANSCYCLKCHWNFWRESFFTLFKMEKFLTTKSKPKKEQHLPVNITASERARQYQRGRRSDLTFSVKEITTNLSTRDKRNYILPSECNTEHRLDHCVVDIYWQFWLVKAKKEMVCISPIGNSLRMRLVPGPRHAK